LCYSPLEGWLEAGVDKFVHLPLKGTPQRGEFKNKKNGKPPSTHWAGLTFLPAVFAVYVS